MLPEHLHSTIPNINRMAGCAKIQTNRGITGNVDTTNTNAPKGPMPRPSLEECCKTVRSSVIVKEVKTNVRWRDELRHQPGPMDHPTQEDRGLKQPKARKTRPMPHCLSQEAVGTAVETTSQVVDRVEEARGGDGMSTQPQAQQTSKGGRLKQTSR